jgi:hypothetical protein
MRYLMGDVPADEAERLDERSITDDELAVHLRVLENDLVDRIARGEAPGVASPYLRDKVRFAQALYTYTSYARPAAGVGRAWNRFAWASLAAVAVLTIALAGYLGLRNASLRNQIVALESDRAAVERRNTALQYELERTRSAPTSRPPSLTATVLLHPPRRGLGNDATVVSIPKGTEQVTFRLLLESDTHTTFWVALREATTSRTLWRSPDVQGGDKGSERAVTVVVPADTFRSQLYSVDLTGVSASGSAELLAQYPIRVVLE